MYKNSFCYGIKTALACVGFLLMTSIADAQTQKSIEDLTKKAQESRRKMDTMLEQTNQRFKEMSDSLNAANMVKSTERSFEWLNQYQAEQKRKQKQKAMMYMVFGVAGFAVLAYGLSRNKRKKVS